MFLGRLSVLVTFAMALATPAFYSVIVTDSMTGGFRNISCINVTHVSINTKVNEILREFSSLMGHHLCLDSNASLELSAGSIRFMENKASIYINFSIVYTTSSKASIELCAGQFKEFVDDNLPKKLGRVNGEVVGSGCQIVNYTGTETGVALDGWTCKNGYILDELLQCVHKSSSSESDLVPFWAVPRMKMNFIINFTLDQSQNHLNKHCIEKITSTTHDIFEESIKNIFKNISCLNINVDRKANLSFGDNWASAQSSVHLIPANESVNASSLISLTSISTKDFHYPIKKLDSTTAVDIPGCSKMSLADLWLLANSSSFYCPSDYFFDTFNLKCLNEKLPLLISKVTLIFQGNFVGDVCKKSINASSEKMFQTVIRDIQQSISHHVICKSSKDLFISQSNDLDNKIMPDKAQVHIPLKLFSLQNDKGHSENCTNQVFDLLGSVLVQPVETMVQNISKICRLNVQIPANYTVSSPVWKCFSNQQYNPVIHRCELSIQPLDNKDSGAHPKERHKRDVTEYAKWSSQPPQCIDMDPPKFQDCPGQPKSITLNSFLNKQVIILPEVTDNSGLVPTITYTPPQFRISAPIHKKILLVIQAVDSAGLSATCNIWLMVDDEIPPELTCPRAVTITEKLTDTMYRVNYSKVNISYSDNSGSVSLAFFPPENSEIPVNQNITVTVVATDESGNTKSCHFMLIVKPQGCFDGILQTRYGVTKNCTKLDSNNEVLICSMTCPHSNIPIQTISCYDGKWNDTVSACNIDDGCPPGYYYNFGLCFECEIGSYQSQQNATDCEKCPVGYSTSRIKSTNFQACLAMCGQNEFSVSGLQPCQPCPQGYHQPNKGSKYCELCTSSEAYCQGKCMLGGYSVSRTSPCKFCPLNYYNRNSHSFNCTSCPANEVTKIVGATSPRNCLPDDCQDKSFRHNCTCFLNQTDFWCTCNGSVCSPANDPCYKQLCGNGGTCHSSGTDWHCQCSPGFTGPTCASPVFNQLQSTSCYYGNCESQDCLLNCENGGNCLKIGSASQCLCKDGFNGHHCENNIDDCSVNYCLNGGHCKDGISNFTCSCPEGFTGILCETNLDDCLNSPCQNNGTCQDCHNGFKCFCQPGYTGDVCETTIDPCDSHPCYNGATCYTGRTCDVAIEFCDPMPCNLNGTESCIPADRECKCLPNWHGEEYRFWKVLTFFSFNHFFWNYFVKALFAQTIGMPAETTLADKALSVFQNLFFMMKPIAFVSVLSMLPVILALLNPCKNSGSCTVYGSKYSCQCLSGFTGSNCEINIDECTSRSCLNNGLCKGGINDFFCQCPQGFAGKFCEIDIDECLHLPCLNSGVCSQLAGDYLCTCSPGFIGKNCETKLYPCQKQPCQNNGVCHEKETGCVCTCLPGFSGDLCEMYSEECLNNSRCLNGAECYRRESEDICRCSPYFIGSDCIKERTSDFDLYFDGKHHSVISIPAFNISSLNELSVCAWSNIESESTYLTLESDKVSIMSLKNSNGLASVFMNDSVQVSTKDGMWHHICLTLDSLKWRVYLDGQQSSQGDITNWSVKDNLRLTFGQKLGTIDEEWVRGYLSGVNIYSSAFSDSKVKNMSRNCQQREPGDIYNWVVTHYYSQDEFDILMPSNCWRKINTALYPVTNIEVTDKVAPVVFKCPKEKVVTSLMSPAVVTWDGPTFTDNVAVVKVKSNYRSGQHFAHGYYRVIYLAYDGNNNSAECSFDLFVRKTQCMDPPPPQSGGRICHNWLHGRYCIPTCMTRFHFVAPTPKFYRCGQEGVWDPATNFPGCAGYLLANYTINGNVVFEGEDCVDHMKLELENKFAYIVNKICSSGLYQYNKKLQVSCSSNEVTRRKRRQAEANGGLYNVSVDITVVPNTKLDMSMTLLIDGIPERILQGIKNDNEINLTLTSVRFQTSPQCQTGQTLQNGSCVECPAGYYVSSDQVCQLCSKGWYSEKSLQTYCIQCPVGTTTAKDGASHYSQCVRVCEAGHFFNDSTSRCELCPLAHYQDSIGQWHCQKCPPGLTTKYEGATTATDCLNLCFAGQELGPDGHCHLCPEGTFRGDDTLSDPYCIPCASDWTTDGPGSFSEEKCKVVKCKKGHYKNMSMQACLPCPVGTYQPMSGEKSCLLCGSSLTTETEGADRKELCIRVKPNEYTCENLCKNRKTCDGNHDLPDCACDTKLCQTTADDGDLNKILLITSMTLTFVALVTLLVVIAVCIHRKNEQFKIKQRIRMYREDTQLIAFTNQAFDSFLGTEHTSAGSHIPIKMATRWHSNYFSSHSSTSKSDVESTNF
ncbi:hypothetical protein Btru_063570 [Bulinus truncatus]|nr:hypothetical protein Btru_063570 [Bulinus truncatus]